MFSFAKKQQITMFLVLVFSLVLSFATVSNQVNNLTFRFVKVHQGREHAELMDGVAGDPWQYRVLADYMLEPIINLFYKLDINRPEPSAFISFRFVQNFLIFVVAFYFYRKLGLSSFISFLGINILAWMMSQAIYYSDLAFSTYFDVLFYLLGAYLLLSDRFWGLLPLIFFAALNRETSGVLILLLPVYVFVERKMGAKRKEAIITFFGMSVLYAVVFFGLRQYFDEQVFITAYDGYKLGKQVLYKNVVNWLSWQRMFMTAGIIPFLALLAYPNWGRHLKIFFWTLVPIWGVVHFFAAVVSETRLFLVPLALVFIPAALSGLSKDVVLNER